MKKEKKESTTEEFEKELEKCQKQRDEYLAGWQRSRADFLNYKKEESERMKELLNYGLESFILKLLPILDNFEQAQKEIPRDKKDKFSEGISQIKKQFEDFLKKQGVEEIKCLGDKFDPNFHEAVEEVETEGESGLVVEVIEKGYQLNGKVIRPAKVKVVK